MTQAPNTPRSSALPHAQRLLTELRNMAASASLPLEEKEDAVDLAARIEILVHDLKKRDDPAKEENDGLWKETGPRLALSRLVPWMKSPRDSYRAGLLKFMQEAEQDRANRQAQRNLEAQQADSRTQREELQQSQDKVRTMLDSLTPEQMGQFVTNFLKEMPRTEPSPQKWVAQDPQADALRDSPRKAPSALREFSERLGLACEVARGALSDLEALLLETKDLERPDSDGGGEEDLHRLARISSDALRAGRRLGRAQEMLRSAPTPAAKEDHE